MNKRLLSTKAQNWMLIQSEKKPSGMMAFFIEVQGCHLINLTNLVCFVKYTKLIDFLVTSGMISFIII